MRQDQIKPLPVFTQRWAIAMWGTIIALLIAPALAMQFTSEVDWGGEDFAAAAALLIGGGAAFEVACRTVRDFKQRVMVGAVLLLIVATVWAHAAVGVW